MYGLNVSIRQADLCCFEVRSLQRHQEAVNRPWIEQWCRLSHRVGSRGPTIGLYHMPDRTGISNRLMRAPPRFLPHAPLLDRGAMAIISPVGRSVYGYARLVLRPYRG